MMFKVQTLLVIALIAGLVLAQSSGQGNGNRNTGSGRFGQNNGRGNRVVDLSGLDAGSNRRGGGFENNNNNNNNNNNRRTGVEIPSPSSRRNNNYNYDFDFDYKYKPRGSYYRGLPSRLGNYRYTFKRFR